MAATNSNRPMLDAFYEYPWVSGDESPIRTSMPGNDDCRVVYWTLWADVLAPSYLKVRIQQDKYLLPVKEGGGRIQFEEHKLNAPSHRYANAEIQKRVADKNRKRNKHAATCAMPYIVA